MIPELIAPEIQAFVASHENDDVHELVLKNKFIHGVPAALVVRQIVGRNKAKTKLPSFYRNERIVYPPSLSLEQSSSEQTAAHKASFVGETISESVCGAGADLTGGLGVDTLYLSRLFKTFHFVEPNADLIEIAKHNLRELGARNVVFHNATAETFLASLDRSFDFVYVDPSRRTEGDNRLVTLADCQPNIVSLQDRLLATAPNVLVKTSPLLDIQRGLAQLREVASVTVVAVGNECKELLYHLVRDFGGEPTVRANNILGDTTRSFEFRLNEEREASVEFSEPCAYLYEPNAAVLKAGAFRLIAERYNVRKLHPNTHVYTSDLLIESFPGRIYRLRAGVGADPSEFERLFPDRQTNIVLRNYPASVDELRKKLRVKDGGEKYLLGVTTLSRPQLLAVERLDLNRS